MSSLSSQMVHRHSHTCSLATLLPAFRSPNLRIHSDAVVHAPRARRALCGTAGGQTSQGTGRIHVLWLTKSWFCGVIGWILLGWDIQHGSFETGGSVPYCCLISHSLKHHVAKQECGCPKQKFSPMLLHVGRTCNLSSPLGTADYGTTEFPS